MDKTNILIPTLKAKGYLDSKIENGEEIFHLNTPCRFRVNEEVVSKIISNYRTYEEIGGIFWVFPSAKNGEKIFQINKVSFIRNAIEDYHWEENVNKSNAYLFDSEQFENEKNKILKQGFLPIRFHTHPVKGVHVIDSLINSHWQTETSKQDRKESVIPDYVGGNKILMPRALIVGSEISNQDIFIGVYNGYIAPVDFGQSKKLIQDKNLTKVFDKVSNINLTEYQKVFILIGVSILLLVMLKYPKMIIPIVIGGASAFLFVMSSTQNIQNPEYFNKLSNGKVDIFIPIS